MFDGDRRAAPPTATERCHSRESWPRRGGEFAHHVGDEPGGTAASRPAGVPGELIVNGANDRQLAVLVGRHERRDFHHLPNLWQRLVTSRLSASASSREWAMLSASQVAPAARSMSVCSHLTESSSWS